MYSCATCTRPLITHFLFITDWQRMRAVKKQRKHFMSSLYTSSSCCVRFVTLWFFAKPLLLMQFPCLLSFITQFFFFFSSWLLDWNRCKRQNCIFTPTKNSPIVCVVYKRAQKQINLVYSFFVLFHFNSIWKLKASYSLDFLWLPILLQFSSRIAVS